MTDYKRKNKHFNVHVLYISFKDPFSILLLGIRAFFFIHVLNINLGIPVLLSVFYKIACCYICFMYISKQLNFAQDSDKFALLCYSLLACT